MPVNSDDVFEKNMSLDEIARSDARFLEISDKGVEDETIRSDDKYAYPHVTADGIEYEWLAGYCPVQAEGTVDGRPFYFRARGNSWKLHIGGPGRDPLSEDSWTYGEEYGKWPEAGWISMETAESFVSKAVSIFREVQQNNTSKPLDSPFSI